MAATPAVVGAGVRTMNPTRPHATAVAIDAKPIVAVADDAAPDRPEDAELPVLLAVQADRVMHRAPSSHPNGLLTEAHHVR